MRNKWSKMADCDASCAGVCPAWLTMLMSTAGDDSNSCTTSTLSCSEQARCSGVRPPLLWLFISAPLCKRSSATRTQFQRQALCNGCQPSSVLMRTSAPFDNSNWKWCEYKKSWNHRELHTSYSLLLLSCSQNTIPVCEESMIWCADSKSIFFLLLRGLQIWTVYSLPFPTRISNSDGPARISSLESIVFPSYKVSQFSWPMTLNTNCLQQWHGQVFLFCGWGVCEKSPAWALRNLGQHSSNSLTWLNIFIPNNFIVKWHQQLTKGGRGRKATSPAQAL